MRVALSESQAGDESDDYLMELMGMKADFPKEAMDAYGKIYTRYWDLMYEIAKGVTRDEGTAADLLSDTFNVIYHKAATFKKGKVRTPQNIRLSICKWMTTIMKRVFYDHFLDDAYKKSSDDEKLSESYIIDKKHIGKYLSDDYDDFIEQIEIIEREPFDAAPVVPEEDSGNMAKIKDYISKLPERDRDIILTFYDHHVPGKYTPSDVLDCLVKKWGTTRENIRKILEKVRKSIREELQPQMFIRK